MKEATVEAGQRGLEAAGLKELAVEPSKLPRTPQEFDAQHAKWCCLTQASFGQAKDKLAYGRAAKLVNVYLKTLFLHNFGEISEQSDSSNGRTDHIHPPIDRRLLDELIVQDKANVKFWRKYRNKGWTNFDEADYRDVIETVRKETNGKLWRIEAHWEPKAFRP